MKTAIIITVMSLLGFTTQAQKGNDKGTKTIVLIHGAWADASAWDGVVPELKKHGNEVITVNLAGHGTDTTSFANISFQTYTDQVKAAIGDRKNVILVGHSFAGLIISQVAEDIPAQIGGLIYVAAALPRDGESLLGLAQTDPGSHIGKSLTVDKEHGQAIIAADGVADIFAADAPVQVQQYLASHIKPEPLAPLATPVHLTEKNFGAIRKVFIYTVNDHAISYGAQQHMVRAGKVDKEHTLTSSHTPFISMPVKLADIIAAESK